MSSKTSVAGLEYNSHKVFNKSWIVLEFKTALKIIWLFHTGMKRICMSLIKSGRFKLYTNTAGWSMSLKQESYKVLKQV